MDKTRIPPPPPEPPEPYDPGPEVPDPAPLVGQVGEGDTDTSGQRIAELLRELTTPAPEKTSDSGKR